MIKELTATEMESVSAGLDIMANSNPDCLCNAAEKEIYATFTQAEKLEVCEQPDRASQRAKMFEIIKRRENNSASTTIHVGATGRW